MTPIGLPSLVPVVSANNPVAETARIEISDDAGLVVSEDGMASTIFVVALPSAGDLTGENTYPSPPPMRRGVDKMFLTNALFITMRYLHSIFGI